MADIFTKKKRSQVMSAVKGKGNKSTELALAKLFRKNGIKGWRRNYSGVIGKPDFVFPKERIAVFVDGCFWHGCKKHRTIPVTRRSFWVTKIERNRERDRLVNRELKRSGWKVRRFWEHELGEEELDPQKIYG
jgi:DNA mismatch endonuclease (patch repair protein)